MSGRKVKPFAKLLLIVLIIGGLGGLYLAFKDQIAPQSKAVKSILAEKEQSKPIPPTPAQPTAPSVAQQHAAPTPAPAPSTPDNVFTLKIGVVTWPGYIGGQYFNNGFKASKSSRFYQKYGFMLEFVILDDPTQSRTAWKTYQVHLVWGTIDTLPAEIDGLKDYGPRYVLQADWSRRGDVIMATHDIKSVKDMRGQPVAFAEMSPSHSLTLLTLQADDMEYTAIKPIPVDNALVAAQYFKEGKVKIAAVWSPDDEDCLKSVPGSHRLRDTGQAMFVIADGFFAKESFINANPQLIEDLIEGRMIGAAEINSNPQAKEKAIQILAAGLGISDAEARNAMEKVRLTTIGDNLNFFGLNPEYKGVTGQNLYEKMARIYNAINLAPASIPAWRSVNYTNAVRNVARKLSGPEHAAEGVKTFTKATPEMYSVQAVTSKTLRISFATGSDQLDENAQILIDTTYGDSVKLFSGARIRIAGHTDSTGNPTNNQALSERRAKAVADYLTKKYGVDPNRFVIVGKGQNEPVASNDTAEGRAKNRRTELQML